MTYDIPFLFFQQKLIKKLTAFQNTRQNWKMEMKIFFCKLKCKLKYKYKVQVFLVPLAIYMRKKALILYCNQKIGYLDNTWIGRLPFITENFKFS
jgi:hypothetical protein